MATVPGIDVSYWDAGIDWPRVRATGQRYVFAKATEGDFYQDTTFDENWFGAKSAGLLRGAYHFYRCNVDAKKQADYFINYVKSFNDNGDLPPVLDLESTDNTKKDKIISGVKTWLDRVEGAFGKKPIIYSGPYYLQDNLSEAGGGPPAWAKDYPLWIAQYPNQYVEGSQPFMPRGWLKWTFWQYSDKGKLNGFGANVSVDINVFNGALEDLYKLAGAQAIIDQPRTPQKHTVAAGDSFESVANKYGLTLRELIGANPQLLKTGDSLTVPVAVSIPAQSAGGGSASVSAAPKTHTVQSGETLYSIAIKYNTNIAAIAALNNLANPNNISVGQALTLP